MNENAKSGLWKRCCSTMSGLEYQLLETGAPHFTPQSAKSQSRLRQSRTQLVFKSD